MKRSLSVLIVTVLLLTMLSVIPISAQQSDTQPIGEQSTESPESQILGDVDGDGTISVTDATIIQQYLSYQNISALNSNRLFYADVDTDGRLSIFDALRIRRYLAQMCNLDGSPYED